MIEKDYATLSLTQICDTGAFDIHPFGESVSIDNNLLRSIEKSGILSPPVVLEFQDNKYDIISGRQRLRCWKLLGKINCHCRILPKQSAIEDILTLVIEDQFFCGQLNIIEQACFIKLCQKHLPQKSHFQSFIGQLLPGRITKGIRFLEPLLKLSANLQYKIFKGDISEKIIAELLRFDEEDRQQFIDLAEVLRLGSNNQKKLIQQLDDIIKRENITLSQFINQKRLKKILDDDSLDRTRKTSNLLALIHHLHQPRLSAAQDAFTERINNLRLPENCSLSSSPSFESNAVTLAVKFNNYQNFEKRWDRIRKILEEL